MEKENNTFLLTDILKEIPDPRSNQGKRHPLFAVLSLACTAMLCGYRSYVAISEWGHNYGEEFMRILGFGNGKPPCAATFFNIFKVIDCEVFEKKIGEWSERLMKSSGFSDETGKKEGIAIDGKSLRGSRKQGAPSAHLLAAVGHNLGITLGQKSVNDKTNEIPVTYELLKNIVIKGRVITTDALLTQRDMAENITGEGGDYVMIVKGNQPDLQETIKTFFDDSEYIPSPDSVAETTDIGHGRIEVRRLTVTAELKEYADWPGAEQFLKIEREVTHVKSGRQTCETVYGVSSLSRKDANAEVLSDYVRDHWKIENRLHWVRDVIFDEDRSQVRTGNIPHIMSSLRNIVIGLMRVTGKVNIAAACRYFAANPRSALILIGAVREN